MSSCRSTKCLSGEYVVSAVCLAVFDTTEIWSGFLYAKLDLRRQLLRIPWLKIRSGFCLDDTGFAKQGKSSVGVARQYSGTLGKVTNCQITVSCDYAERTLAWPVATRLYLPKARANDPARRQKVYIPETVRFQTNAEIALELLDRANDWGARHTCVIADADYGHNPQFLDGLEERHERYVASVRANFKSPSRSGAPLQPARAWRMIYWQEGTQG